MKFVALLSGGKDSIYATMKAIDESHDLVCAAHLSPPESTLELDSYMYQCAGSIVLPTLVRECLGIPLIMRPIRGKSINTSLVYEGKDPAADRKERADDAGVDGSVEDYDEVEDLYQLLRAVTVSHPDVKGVSCGAILSTYQRVRLENVCSRLGLTPLCYLWRWKPQADILDDMLADGVRAVLVKVAYPLGLTSRRHLNKELGPLRHNLAILEEKYNFHVCGEGGEYETLVLDCPLFKKRLVLDEVEVVPDEEDDSSGVLRILSFHAEEKEAEAVNLEGAESSGQPICTQSSNVPPLPSLPPAGNSMAEEGRPKVLFFLPQAKMLPGGLFHTSEILSRRPSLEHDEAAAAVEEALEIFAALRQTLWKAGLTPQDVVLCHLYLSKISHFARINEHYKAFFGTSLPPSRSCVAVGRHVLPGGRRVLLDAVAQRSSGRWMRTPRVADGSEAYTGENSHLETQQEAPEMHSFSRNKLREVLHVQGLSYWAPICVGPYSQANTIRGALQFIAGQIGLHPPTMKLCSPGLEDQLRQSWKNAASVLDALSDGVGATGRLENCLGALVYVQSSLVLPSSCGEPPVSSAWAQVRNICHEEIARNAGIYPGTVEGMGSTSSSSDPYNGYEDEGTMLEMEGRIRQREEDGRHDKSRTQTESPQIPILFIGIPEMPVGAICEVELVCVSAKASACLDVQTRHMAPKHILLGRDGLLLSDRGDQASVSWECGYDLQNSSDFSEVAGIVGATNGFSVETSIRFAKSCSAMAWGKLKPVASCVRSSENPQFIETDVLVATLVDAIVESIEASGLDTCAMLHFRMYYSSQYVTADDGLTLRSALTSELTRATKLGNAPSARSACSVVPVESLEDNSILAAQVTVCDLIHMETEMWIHHGRHYGA